MLRLQIFERGQSQCSLRDHSPETLIALNWTESSVWLSHHKLVDSHVDFDVSFSYARWDQQMLLEYSPMRRVSSLITSLCPSQTPDHVKPKPKRNHLCSSDGTTLTSTPLSWAQVGNLTTNDCLRLLNNLLAFGQDQLNVARVRHVRVDLHFHQFPI
jgi:hypothetical protein